MSDNYVGWKLFEKVIIVAKELRSYQKLKYSSDEDAVQGYLVDPTNKKQLKTALRWAEWTEYGTYNPETREYDHLVEHKGVVHEFDNRGFTLELLASAEGSSQGGKLSFWNCKVTKDDKSFIIGIAADLLLDVLRNTTVVNGVVQEPLFFARCKGGVGMLSEKMEAYQQAVSDMTRRKTMSRGKTSRFVVGNTYCTTTQTNVYLGELYQWYEPIMENDYWGRTRITGLKKLDEPIKLYFYPDYYNDCTKMSDYIKKAYSYWMKTKKPASRVEGELKVELDADINDLINRLVEEAISVSTAYVDDKKKGLTRSRWTHIGFTGLSTNGSEYTMPENLVKAIKDYDYILS